MRFLSTEEIIDLTGYQRASSQAKWLARQGIRHWINGQGQVRVADTAVDEAISGKQTTTGKQPNFEALQKAS